MKETLMLIAVLMFGLYCWQVGAFESLQIKTKDQCYKSCANSFLDYSCQDRCVEDFNE